MRQASRYRTFFWPAVLILAGVIALLVNTGLISADRLIQLVDLWPLILIVIGLELIVRRAAPPAARDVAAALIVLIAVAGAVVYVAVGPNPSATHAFDSVAPAGELQQASLEVNAGSATITISSGTDIGADLYRAHVQYSGSKPDVSFDRANGSLRIDQGNRSLFGGRFTLDLKLAPALTWQITENTGASTDTINVAQNHVSGISINTGASREEITLGPATGIVPVEIDGGALTVHLHRPSGTQASVGVSGGAINLTADGKHISGFGDQSYQSPGFGRATDGYKIQVNGGACTVTLDTSTASD